jgi:hypothetical protein
MSDYIMSITGGAAATGTQRQQNKSAGKQDGKTAQDGWGMG